MSQANHRRIAKNTLMLYIRMLLTMGVSLFTVRIVLDTLGETDYGIYNVVAGIVTMFSFLSGTMASASQRFLAFEIGRKNYDKLKKTFNMTMIIYLMIGIVILLLAETVGFWFLNHKMTIPADRMVAARWVYHFSILSFMMTMFTIPYNAAIIAYEKMNVYAYVSIIEVSLKLLIVYLLVIFSFDKLKLYAVLMFGVTTLVTFIYRLYCINQFKETKLKFDWDTTLFKEIISYSGWNLFGALASILKNQGINILLNVFFNPAINAARGIAYQISSAVNQFVINFSTAVNPQIIKYYSIGENEKMNKLVFQSSKFSFYLLFLLSIPLLFETNFVLSLWLKEVPEYTILFTRLVIINALIDSLSTPLITSALATGNIKNYQIVVGGTMLLNLPLSYIFLKLAYPPEITMYIAIIIACANHFLRLLMLHKLIKFPITHFLSKVVLKIIRSTALAILIPFFIVEKMDSSNARFLYILVGGTISGMLFIYLAGLSKKDKIFLKEVFMAKIGNRFS